MVVHGEPRRFTVAEYYRMAEVGILTEDDRVELIEGEIVRMSPIGSRHAGCVNGCTALFYERFRDVGMVTVQNPVRLDDLSEPEPDLALVRIRSDHYATAHPTPGDVFLLVEVADTSVGWDRRKKVPLYARSGIPECWLVDLGRDIIDVYREPGPDGYRIRLTARRGQTIAPQAFPDREMAVDEILGLK